MATEKILVDKFLALANEYPVVDVRSPGEYHHAHLPGAYSLPLFTNDERKVVGTAYKQESREQAIKIGLDFFGTKMRKMVEEIEALIESRCPLTETNNEQQSSNIVLVYCWRGGMRSAAVSWLLDLYGFKVYTLVGGYKKFRHYVLDTFKQPFRFNILGGYTGSGKTELLQALVKKGEAVIDLEDIAKHKGSAFGNIDMPVQPGQEMFENLLALELLKRLTIDKLQLTADSVNGQQSSVNSAIWLEDESQRIGLVNLPNDFWNTMRQSPVYFLDIPFEERLLRIVQEYGPLDCEKMIEAIGRISEKLGHLNAKTAILLLKEGNIAESFRILLKYYDKFYLKALHNRKATNSLLFTVPCKSVTIENVDLLIPILQDEQEKP